MVLEFRDILNHIETRVGKEYWVYLYKRENSLIETSYMWSAIVPDEFVGKALDTINWDLHLGEGLPGFGSQSPKFEPEYLRFGNFEGIEPLVFIREFQGLKDNSIDFSQEFIHYFNLYFDKSENRYYEILTDGNQEEVLILDETFIKVRLKHLKIYLAAKKSHLALYFDIWRISDKSLDELNIKKQSINVRKDNYNFTYETLDNNRFSYNNPKGKSCSWFLGKVLIPPKANFNLDTLQGSEERKFGEYIVGIDKNGDEVYKKCNPSGPNEFLIPVFFDREVLRKYFDNPQRYEVLDCFLRCRSIWSMPIDNDNRGYVAVFLGDLGKHLSYKEQMYWKGFNINIDGSLSRTYRNRSLMNKITSPGMPDLLFKQRLKEFAAFWYTKFGWHFFKPLNESDIHLLSTLRIPLSESPAEFEQQVLSLTKILVDSINEKEISKLLSDTVQGQKGIDKLEALLREKSVRGYVEHVKFLRNLQSLRSTGVAHRKGKKFDKEIDKLKFVNLGQKGYKDNFFDILNLAIEFIDFLQAIF